MPPPSQVPASQVQASPNVRSTRFSLRSLEHLNIQQSRSTQQSPSQQQSRSTQQSPSQQQSRSTQQSPSQQHARSTQQSPPQQQARSTQPSPTQQATTQQTSTQVVVNQQPINADESADENEERNVEWETASEQEPDDPKQLKLQRSFVWSYFKKKTLRDKKNKRRRVFNVCHVKIGNEQKPCCSKYAFNTSTTKLIKHLKNTHNILDPESKQKVFDKETWKEKLNKYLLFFIITSFSPFRYTVYS